MTVLDYLERHAFHNPDQIAIMSEDTQFSFKELYEIIIFNQNQLKNIKKKKIILKIGDQIEYIITLLVLFSLETWVIPVPSDIKMQELNKIKSSIDESILIDEINNPIILKRRSGVLKKIDGQNTGIYHMTSGSTGNPKFCIRTIKNLTHEGESYMKTITLNCQDKILNIPPLFHSYALGGSCISGLVTGATLFTINEFIPRKILNIIEKEKPSVMILVPFMAKMIAKSFLNESKNFSSLRIVLAGAGKITEEIYDMFLKRFNLPLMSNYGSTETGGIVTRLSATPFDSIGKPMDGVELILKDENGSIIKNGNEGEIWVKTHSMALGYLNHLPMILDNNGFFPMNDFGFQDKDGNIYITKRKKSIINIGGKKINPLEIEEILLNHSEIEDCIVLGIMLENGNEMIGAIIVSKNNLSEEEIKKYCRTKLSDFKSPSIIKFSSHIPRNSIGKVKYNFIQEQISE